MEFILGAHGIVDPNAGVLWPILKRNLVFIVFTKTMVLDAN